MLMVVKANTKRNQYVEVKLLSATVGQTEVKGYSDLSQLLWGKHFCNLLSNTQLFCIFQVIQTCWPSEIKRRGQSQKQRRQQKHVPDIHLAHSVGRVNSRKMAIAGGS